MAGQSFLVQDRPSRAGSALPDAWVEYLPAADLGMCLAQRREHALGVIGFGQTPASGVPAACPQAQLPMRPLHAGALAEVWFSGQPLAYALEEGLSIAAGAHIAFGVLALSPGNLERAAFQAYEKILGLIRRRGYPHLLRVWNHFSAIHAEEAGIERYQAFCLGRHEAFRRLSVAARDLPAASGVGTQGQGFWIYFLAAREAGVAVENPRQVSAYHYPRQYGPRSPSFARATLKAWTPDEWHLYISGTASIVGHRSCHVGDCRAQLEETIRNLEAVRESAVSKIPWARSGADAETLLKVYVRDEAHLPLIRDGVGRAFGAASALYLQADICRPDLLLEIEGVLRIKRSSHA